MKLVVSLKLVPDALQEKNLRRTLGQTNEACNWISEQGFEVGKIQQYDLHKFCYRQCRERFALSAQVVVRCIAKVADAYKSGKKNTKRTFGKFAAQPYDDHIVSFKAGDVVSLWTMEGRIKLKVRMNQRQRDLLVHRKGEIDLMLVRGKWYLACVCDITEPEQIEVTKVLGIDLGIQNIAVDSDGRRHTGERIEEVRRRLARRRTGLQRHGTKAAKRKLRKLSGKQARFQRQENHRISKAVVLEAQRSGRAIGLEDIKIVRNRVKASRSHRAKLGNWSFGQFRQFVEYKARRAGIPVLFINPANTSRTCPECGLIDEANRPNQAIFSCVWCGHQGHADIIAAQNIRSRAEAELVTRPYVLGPPLG